jgi:lysozyme family protein
MTETMFNKQFDDLMILECGSPLGKPPWGITQSIFDSWAISKNVGPYNVLHIPRAVASDFAEQEYYIPAGCSQLSLKLGFVHFQCSYNTGIVEAVKILQRSVGVTEDGIFGPKTLAAVNHSNEPETIKIYLTYQNEFYKSIENKANEVWENGWHHRVTRTARLVGVSLGNTNLNAK